MKDFNYIWKQCNFESNITYFDENAYCALAVKRILKTVKFREYVPWYEAI